LAAYRRIKKYARAANITIDQAVNDAVREWMDMTGDLLLEEEDEEECEIIKE
jgi:hypothetical protein